MKISASTFVLKSVLILLLIVPIQSLDFTRTTPPNIYMTTDPIGIGEWLNEKLIIFYKPFEGWMTLTCNATYPIDWDFNGTFNKANDISKFTRQRHFDLDQSQNQRPSGLYTFETTVKFGEEYGFNGLYICKSLLGPTIYTSVFVGEDTKSIRVEEYTFLSSTRLDENVALLPCTFSHFEPETKPTLIKHKIEGEIQEISNEKYVSFDTTKGFYLKTNQIQSPWGDYTCYLKYKNNTELNIAYKLVEPLGFVFSPEQNWFAVEETFKITCAANDTIEIRRPSTDDYPNVIYFQNKSSPYIYNAQVSMIEHSAECVYNKSKDLIKSWTEVLDKELTFHKDEEGHYGEIRCGVYSIPIEKYECDEPAECNFLKKKFEDSTLSTKCSETIRDETSHVINADPILRPSVARCASNLSNIQTYLFDLDKNIFSLNEVHNKTSNELVRIQAGQSEAYLSEDIKFVCTAIRYLFANIYWAFSFANGSTIFVPPPATDNNETQFVGHLQLRTTILKMNDKSIASVSCYAPFWNSFDWAIANHTIKVKDKAKPQIIGSNNIERIQLSKSASRKQPVQFACDVSGHPKPTIHWEGNFDRIKGLFDSRTVSLLSVSEIDAAGEDENEFTCVASNPFGQTRKTYQTFVSSGLHGGIIAAIVVLIVLVIIAIVLFFLRQQRNMKILKNLLTEKDVKDFLEGSSEVTAAAGSSDDTLATPQSKSFPEKYKINRNDFIIDQQNLLGYGAYGIVFKGTHTRSTSNANASISQSVALTVAIKTLKQGANVEYVKSLLAEIKTMAFVGSHEHVVEFMGACVNNIAQNEIYVLLEFCNNGSLETFLRKRRPDFQDTDISEMPYSNIHSGKITTRHLLEWSTNIANAMKYLAQKKVIHGDLAARNVLLTQNLIAKVADFGLAKQLYNHTQYTRKGQQLLPWAWMALESLRDREFSIQSDIWAFGVTLWEIFSLGQVPYGGLGFTMEFINMLKLGLRLPKPVHASSQIYEIMTNCWDNEPKRRQTIENIAYILKLIGKSASTVQTRPAGASTKDEFEIETTEELKVIPKLSQPLKMSYKNTDATAEEVKAIPELSQQVNFKSYENTDPTIEELKVVPVL